MKEILTQVLFYSHLLGFAAFGGGLLAQLTASKRRITGVVVNGVRWQLFSGIAMVGLAQQDYNMTVVAIKLGIVIVILAICEALRKKPQISNKVYWLLVVLLIIQTAVALSVEKSAPATVMN